MQDRKRVFFTALEHIKDLPNLPDVVYRLEEVANNPDAGVREIAAVIETDPPMAARLLRVANSVFYLRGDRPLLTIQQAVVRLGLSEVRRMCLSVGAMRMFVRPSVRVDHREFWRHCLTVASTTRAVAKLTSGVAVDAEQAFVVGLLHEVGALVLDQFFEKIYDTILHVSHQNQQFVTAVENDYLGLDHGAVGAWLLERWSVPAPLVNAVRFHHAPQESPEEARILTQVLHVADYICSTSGNCGPGEHDFFVMNATAWEDLGLSVDSLPELYREVAAQSDRNLSFVSCTS